MMGTAGRHTPKILRKQLLYQFCEQYKTSILTNHNKQRNLSDISEQSFTSPSIERFNGALLFIDISGFTMLSQQLNVEDLKNQINDYFTKMLDLVDKHGGDVIKFAGDALYIAWYGSSGGMSFHDVVSAAVVCGMEIIKACSNHKIEFNQISAEEKSPQTRLIRQLLPTLNALFGQTKTFSTSNELDKPVSENTVFLNVHAGISVGQMAGVDIGVGDRWE
jgi:class 3 adenylate cyclase